MLIKSKKRKEYYLSTKGRSLLVFLPLQFRFFISKIYVKECNVKKKTATPNYIKSERNYIRSMPHVNSSGI